MKAKPHYLAAIVLLATTTAADAQFVKGNEAVKVMPDGTKKVDAPPLPAKGTARTTKPCAADAGCYPGPWHMVETNDGLRECTEPFARASTCRGSTYGSQKLSRVWVAKKGSAWLWCQFPDLSSKCVDMHAKPPLNLPTSAVQ
jgi:hypothetical protein